MAKKEKTKFITPDIMKSSIIGAFQKLDPRYMIKNPVMFVVELGFFITLVLTIFPTLFGEGGENRIYNGIVTVVLFIMVLFANFAESVAEGRGKAQAATLKKTKKDTKARVIRQNGEEEMIFASELRKGDIVLVKMGEVIPNDGEVIEGIASVDESAITGESAPVTRESGGDFSSVTGGTTVVSDWLKIRIVAEPGESFLDKMISLVEGASRQKTPNEIALNTLLIVLTVIFMIVVITLYPFANYLGVEIPISWSIALMVCLIPTTIGGLLSAIGIAGMDRVTRFNVIAMSGKAVEACGDVDTMILDKTGTITKGEPQVTDMVPAKGISEEELLGYAYALEKKSEHPLAKAIIARAEEKKIVLQKVSDFQALPGNGLRAALNSDVLTGGNMKFISNETSVSPELMKQAEKLAGEGKTPLLFAKGGKFLGIIAVADVIKEDSPQAIKELQNMGIRVVMLTGDNERTAKAIGSQAGVDDVIAGVLPDGKESVIRSLKEQGKVAMVGDGINDAPALTRADIGIAIGAGTDVAIDAADVVLMKSRLSDVPAAIRLSRATLRNIHENLFWAFFYNVIGIPLAAGVWIPIFGWTLNPMFGAAAMSLSSFCVVTNALRLNLFKVHDASRDKKIKQNVEEIHYISANAEMKT